MIWFILIAIDLMIFLIQRQTLRSFPFIGGNMLDLSFLFLLEWASICEKLESIMLAPESKVSQTWSMQMKKIHQHWVSILFLTCALDMVRFPCRQHSRCASPIPAGQTSRSANEECTHRERRTGWSRSREVQGRWRARFILFSRRSRRNRRRGRDLVRIEKIQVIQLLHF